MTKPRPIIQPDFWERRLAGTPGRFGIYAKNLRTGRATCYHEDEVFPSASLIKVPIMIEAFRRFEEEGTSLDALLTMRAEDQVDGSGVLRDLTPGTAYSIRDLTTLMISVSDNTATNLLIDHFGTAAVNLTLRRLGARHTELVRKLQRVPVDRPTANRTTAWDMALLMERLATGTAISEAVSRQMVDMLTRCQGRLSIGPAGSPASFFGQPPAVTAAHKTGSLSDARHDAGIVYTPQIAYIAAILSAGAPAAVLEKAITRIGRLLPRMLR
ncbi:MAG: class A beta-lactamase-related serine hydrolase [Thermaerobacter sp.]|nr:class A beta-lactamase-related serine hydrolase [Thermaerobacter sp.]